MLHFSLVSRYKNITRITYTLKIYINCTQNVHKLLTTNGDPQNKKRQNIGNESTNVIISEYHRRTRIEY